MNLVRFPGQRRWVGRAAAWCVASVCALAFARIGLGATGTISYSGGPTEKADTRKPPAALASLPAPAAAGPLRILLVDDDWSENNAGGTQRLSASDEIFRDLVAAAVGGDTAAWSVEIAETYKNGPAFERLREFNVVLWYTGASYGGGADNIAVLSIEDEKTVRRYLEETGGSFILVSPGYVNNLSYGSTWTGSPHPFLKQVMGIDGFYGLVQRFAAGQVQVHDGSSYTVEQKPITDTQFSAVNSDGAAIVFTASLDPLKTAKAPVPVAVAHPFAKGRFTYVGFTFENIPKPDLTQAFARLLEASGVAAPNAASVKPVATVRTPPEIATLPSPAPATSKTKETTPKPAPGEAVTEAPKAFAVTGSGRDSFNFYASQLGPIRVQVQSRGAPVVITVFHPDGRKVDQTGSGEFTFEDTVSAADIARGHVWGIGVRAASATTASSTVASGSIIVTHPASDRAAVQAQLDTLPSRTQVVVQLTEQNRGTIKPTLIGATVLPTTTTPPSPMANATVTIMSPVVMGQTVPLPPREPIPVVRYSIMEGGPGAPMVVFGKDLFPPGTGAGRVRQNTAAYPAEVHFITPDGQEITVAAAAVEDFYNGRVGNDTETDPQVTWDGRPFSTRYQRNYTISVPHVVAQQNTTLVMYFKSTDGRVSPRVNFTYKPPMRDEYMWLPIGPDGKLYDSTISSIYPNITLTDKIKRDSYLLGFTGYDTFYNSYQLRNGWKVMGVEVKLGYGLGSGAEIVEHRIGTPSPYVKVRWYLEPTFLMSSDLAYTIKIHVRGPTEFEPFW
jgi:hypothetical protein